MRRKMGNNMQISKDIHNDAISDDPLKECQFTLLGHMLCVLLNMFQLRLKIGSLSNEEIEEYLNATSAAACFSLGSYAVGHLEGQSSLMLLIDLIQSIYEEQKKDTKAVRLLRRAIHTAIEQIENSELEDDVFESDEIDSMFIH